MKVILVVITARITFTVVVFNYLLVYLLLKLSNLTCSELFTVRILQFECCSDESKVLHLTHVSCPSSLFSFSFSRVYLVVVVVVVW